MKNLKRQHPDPRDYIGNKFLLAYENQDLNSIKDSEYVYTGHIQVVATSVWQSMSLQLNPFCIPFHAVSSCQSIHVM